MARVMAILGVLVATGLIVGSYRFMSQTADEPAHVGAGMQWLSQGQFTLDPLDPPLPRISVAVGPYLLGARPTGQINVWREGDRILHERDPEKLLTAARLGTLPWFLLLTFLVWRRTRLWLGEWAAVASVWLLALCPTILANAALATTDICFTACYFLAVEALWFALERPTLLSFGLVGAAVGLALLAKFSTLAYVGLCIIVACLLFFRRYGRLPAWRMLAVACVAGFLVVGTGYRWIIGPLATHHLTSQQKVEHLLNKAGRFRPEAHLVADHLPLAPFVQGLILANRFGHLAIPVYFLGRNHPRGVLGFYSVIFLAKTPIPLLLLGFAGLGIAFWHLSKRPAGTDDYTVLALSAMILPFLFATILRVNQGLRHVLVIYPFFVMFASLAVLWLWRTGSRRQALLRGLVVLLFGWEAISTIRAFPDLLVYANEVAAPYARSISIDSDYDWGQDLNLLIADLAQRHVNQLWIEYSGFNESDMKRLPRWHTLPDGKPVNGWIAISEQAIRRYPEDYGWLNRYKPVEEVGHTIRLYYLDPALVPSSMAWDQRVEPTKPEEDF